jgi:hypothetical protein
MKKLKTTNNRRIRLYHFTRREYLASILNIGLDTGDVPLSPTESVMGISFTENPSTSPLAQNWTTILPQKLGYRLTVELELSDRLMRWRYVPKVIRMDWAWWKRLDGDPYRWWVFFGVVPTEKIVEVVDTRANRVLSANEVLVLKAEKQRRASGYFTKFVLVPFEEARVKPSVSNQLTNN